MSHEYQEYAVVLSMLILFAPIYFALGILATEIAIFIARMKCIFCNKKYYPKIK